MSDISLPGVSSKYNTPKLVDDLVAAERIRLTRMEEEVSLLEESRSIWRDISRDIGGLQRAVKSLYGFENPFAEKTAVSSDESVLTAEAARGAPFDNYSIVVKQVASADRFLSASLERSFRIEAGRYTFSVGEQTRTLRYRGGSAADFARMLSEKGEGLVRASTVRDTPDTQVLIIEAVPTGSANRLGFGDDARELALRTGMMRRAQTASGTVTPRNIAGSPSASEGGAVNRESISITDESILVGPLTSLRIPLDDAVKMEDGMILEYSYRTLEHEEGDSAPPPPLGPLWPEVPQGSYKGLTVRSAPNDMVLPPSAAPGCLECSSGSGLRGLFGTAVHLIIPGVPPGSGELRCTARGSDGAAARQREYPPFGGDTRHPSLRSEPLRGARTRAGREQRGGCGD